MFKNGTNASEHLGEKTHEKKESNAVLTNAMQRESPQCVLVNAQAVGEACPFGICWGSSQKGPSVLFGWILRACHCFMLRCFARQNRKALSMLFMTNFEQKTFGVPTMVKDCMTETGSNVLQ